MRKALQISILMIATLLAVTRAPGQKSIEALRDEITRAEEEIRRGNALLGETRRDQAAGQRELKLLQSRISSREKILSALREQVSLLSGQLHADSSRLAAMTEERAQLRQRYAAMVRLSYKNHLLNNYLAFIFASRDFDDATRRLNYIRRYNQRMERGAALIDSLSGVILVRMVETDLKKCELDKTRGSQTAEIDRLTDDRKQYTASLTRLKGQESKLSKDLAAKRVQLQRAQEQIARMVAAEAKKSGSKPLSAEQQRDVAALSGRFDDNRGKLPWPVRGGVMVDRYGLHAHPTQKGLTVNNKGVNIAAASGAEVRCVFEGTVATIFFLPGLNNNVMVRHGNYITVYSNLASVAVKVGDKVSINQSLGRLSSSDVQEECSLHFEVWKESVNLNPETWLMP